MDRKATAELITEAIREGGKAEIEPVFKQKARSFINGDIGNTYVECDLDEQHIYVYVDGEQTEYVFIFRSKECWERMLHDVENDSAAL